MARELWLVNGIASRKREEGEGEEGIFQLEERRDDRSLVKVMTMLVVVVVMVEMEV